MTTFNWNNWSWFWSHISKFSWII